MGQRRPLKIAAQFRQPREAGKAEAEEAHKTPGGERGLLASAVANGIEDNGDAAIALIAQLYPLRRAEASAERTGDVDKSCCQSTAGSNRPFDEQDRF